MATREEKRERGGNEGKDCRRGRGNLKVRGRKEKVVEDKGKERADGGREWTARKRKGNSGKREGKGVQYDRSKRNQ